MTFAIGSLVKARGREWVVLPESKDDLLILKPLAGTEHEIAGIYLPLEKVESATFPLPDPKNVGDHHSCGLLRDAARLSTRAGAGPFRCFSRIGVAPRSYQLVPLLLALRQNPVRLLIADDVGIGKTIEALLIARELLDRGEIQRIAVLCPPHLAEQWQRELKNKFHIDATLVLRSTASKLDRDLAPGESIFEKHPFVVVSMDFIKSDRRRDDFLKACPEFVIVDEAHTCSFASESKGSRHQRFELVKGLADNPNRHLLLVTATPHSGKEDAFRSLLTILDHKLSSLPTDLLGKEHEQDRRQLAHYLIQRRRGDIQTYVGENTPFPTRQEKEETYRLSREYKEYLEAVLEFARKTLRKATSSKYQKRVCWWATLGLLRSVSSSPAAAEQSFRNRAITNADMNPDVIDEIAERTVMDGDIGDDLYDSDITPGTEADEIASIDANWLREAKQLENAASKLKGINDKKLEKAIESIRNILIDGFSPIIFCRFIQTAEYVAAALQEALPKDVQIEAVTGLIPPSEREDRVLALAKYDKKVLVCTDCLSEGVNLQEYFDSVMHYDLAWSPTRHEQREGRVDRFGQIKQIVRVLTFYGADNPVDGMILDVLLRKHKKIRSTLGILVPVPTDSNALLEAIFEGLILKEQDNLQQILPGLEKEFGPKRDELHKNWELAADREKRSQTMFAQQAIKVDEVAKELEEARRFVGDPAVVQKFTIAALQTHGASVAAIGKSYKVSISDLPRGLTDILPVDIPEKITFDYPIEKGSVYLPRTHPFVEGIASYILESALDNYADSKAKRAGTIITDLVEERTTLLLVRFRYDLSTQYQDEKRNQILEEIAVVGFVSAPENAKWLPEKTMASLVDAQPSRNITDERKIHFVNEVLSHFEFLLPNLAEEAQKRASKILDSHERVREVAKLSKRGLTYAVSPNLPPDILGVYVYLPSIKEGSI